MKRRNNGLISLIVTEKLEMENQYPKLEKIQYRTIFIPVITEQTTNKSAYQTTPF